MEHQTNIFWRFYEKMKKKFLSMAVACSMLAAVGSSALTANAIEIEEETS